MLPYGKGHRNIALKHEKSSVFTSVNTKFADGQYFIYLLRIALIASLFLNKRP